MTRKTFACHKCRRCQKYYLVEEMEKHACGNSELEVVMVQSSGLVDQIEKVVGWKTLVVLGLVFRRYLLGVIGLVLRLIWNIDDLVIQPLLDFRQIGAKEVIGLAFGNRIGDCLAGVAGDESSMEICW